MLRLFALVWLFANPAFAWTCSSLGSSFAGSALIVDRSVTYSDSMMMKKGKPNVPPQMRGEYKRQQQLRSMQKEMRDAMKPGADGLPLFNLYIRSKTAKMWYPCGSFKGDERSAALCKSYADNGILAGISKKQLDAGVAGSLFRDQDKLKESCMRSYPQLRKNKDDLEFGFKLAFAGLSEEQSKEIKVVEPKEQKGVLDGIKNLFS